METSVVLRGNVVKDVNITSGAKVYRKWLQERIDDHNIQFDYKHQSGLKVEFNIVRYACVMTLHDYKINTSHNMTIMTDFRTEHIYVLLLPKEQYAK